MVQSGTRDLKTTMNTLTASLRGNNSKMNTIGKEIN